VTLLTGFTFHTGSRPANAGHFLLQLDFTKYGQHSGGVRCGEQFSQNFMVSA
jgi:hypothetical protein